MNAIKYTLVVILLWCSGCASTPLSESLSAEAWPDSVASTCPERERDLECFRKPSIEAAMRGLIERFQACYRPGDPPVKVMLNVETRNGSPSCVESTPSDNQTARCLASVVANHFMISQEYDGERCQFRYPLYFE